MILVVTIVTVAPTCQSTGRAIIEDCGSPKLMIQLSVYGAAETDSKLGIITGL